jgi:hypothetical protein
VISKNITSILFLLSGVYLINGCVSSGETGAEGERALSPVRILGPIDTARYTYKRTVQKVQGAQIKNDSAKSGGVKNVRKAPTFKSKYDTVHVAMVANTKKNPRVHIPIERPEHPFYTIQIGAFGKVANALRAQKNAKDRYSELLVYNNFIKEANLYRVSIGRFENLKEAFSFRKVIMQHYPREYSQSWINIIP